MSFINNDMREKNFNSSGRRSIRKMRRFVTQEHLSMIEAQKKLMQTRDAMDAARHEVSVITKFPFNFHLLFLYFVSYDFFHISYYDLFFPKEINSLNSLINSFLKYLFKLKQTRTTEMVEEKGKFYARMVSEFDQQAARVAAFPERLSTDKLEHQKELFDVWLFLFSSCNT